MNTNRAKFIILRCKAVFDERIFLKTKKIRITHTGVFGCGFDAVFGEIIRQKQKYPHETVPKVTERKNHIKDIISDVGQVACPCRPKRELRHKTTNLHVLLKNVQIFLTSSPTFYRIFIRLQTSVPCLCNFLNSLFNLSVNITSVSAEEARRIRNPSCKKYLSFLSSAYCIWAEL